MNHFHDEPHFRHNQQGQEQIFQNKNVRSRLPDLVFVFGVFDSAVVDPVARGALVVEAQAAGSVSAARTVRSERMPPIKDHYDEAKSKPNILNYFKLNFSHQETASVNQKRTGLVVNSSVIRTKKNSSGFDNQTGKTYTAIA